MSAADIPWAIAVVVVFVLIAVLIFSLDSGDYE